MTDFEEAGILTEMTGKGCYSSTRYRLSSEIRSVNGGGMMLHAKRPGGPVAAVQNCATYGPLSIWHGVEDVRRGALCGGRLVVVEEGLSHHEAGRRFGIDRRTVKKMLSYSSPPGYRRSKPVRRPKLDGFTGIVDAILGADADPEVPRMQRHTAYRIFERLRCLTRSADRSLRGLRVCAGPGLLDRPGAIPSRGLLGAGGSAWALHTAQQRLAGPVNRPDRGSHPTAGERHPAGHGVAQGEHQPIGRRCAGMVDGDECADPDHLVKRKDIVNEISDFAASQSTIGAVDGTAPHL